MIEIRGNFIKSTDGSWHNLKNIRSLYVGAEKDVGFRICFSYEFTGKTSMEFLTIGETHKKQDDAQAQLDALMELLEYEKT